MLVKEHVAKENGIDHTMALMQEGYSFIHNRVKQFHSDIFETRLLGEKVICMTGEEATAVFYDPERFMKNGAAPKHVQRTLFGENAIQCMDGKAHLHRKQLFLSLTASEHQKKLADLVMLKWEAALQEWMTKDQVILFDEAAKVLCEAACEWAGVPLAKSETKDRAEDFCAMVDGFGAVGTRYFKGKNARSRAEEWIVGLIEEVRSGTLPIEGGTALHSMAHHREYDGTLIAANMAAIELINLLRPIVAISTFITFSALALHHYPECLAKLTGSDNQYYELFAQEVRRYYPFAPFLGARVKKDFVWKECYFTKGTLVLLDIYGTNHDVRIWEDPFEFEPERFRNWKGNLYSFIPQGGGATDKTHRCPGEGISVELMKKSIDFLVNKVIYTVPKQTLRYPMDRIPTLPESGFIITNVKAKA